MSKFPQAWLTASAKSKSVNARIDMSADVAGRGLCPECKTPMKVMTVGGSRMWTCASDRISLPLPNDE